MSTANIPQSVQDSNQQQTPLDSSKRTNPNLNQLDLRIKTLAKFQQTLDPRLLQHATFTATYNSSWEKPRLFARIKSTIGDFFKAIITPFVYLGAYRVVGDAKAADKRTNEARENLQKIGGVLNILETPDGDKIETLHISAKEFYNKIYDRYDIKKSDDGKSSYLQLKQERKKDGQITNEDREFAEALHGLGFSKDYNGNELLYDKIGFQDEQLRTLIEPTTPKESDNTSTPTALILPTTYGHGFHYTLPAMRYLQNGVDVMLVNFRGNARSSGTPNDRRLKLDAETCFQFLQGKNIQNKDILVHGHCAGGGVATDLAARHEGVNLYLDRTFSHIEDFANRQFGRFGTIAQAALDFNNEKNLKKATGHIAINVGLDDRVIGIYKGNPLEKDKQLTQEERAKIDQEIDRENKQINKLIQAATHAPGTDKIKRVVLSDLRHVGFFAQNEQGETVKDVLGNTSLVTFLHDIKFTRKI